MNNQNSKLTTSQALSKMSEIKQSLSSKKLQAGKSRCREGWTQDVIPLEKIQDGICVMKDKTYIKILEVSANNYNQQTFANKLAVTTAYATMFTSSPVTVKLKIATENISVAPLIRNYNRARYVTENEEWFLRRKQDLMDSIKNLVHNNSYQTKYYIIFKYEDKVTSNWDEIYNYIYSAVDNFFSSIQNCDCNLVIHQDENLFTMEYLYNFFNPKSQVAEDYEYRADRIITDFARYNETHKQKRNISERDIFGSRGIYFEKSDYWQMDGMYFTHLIINGNSIPDSLSAGWLNNFVSNGIDVDLIIRRKNTELVRTDLEASLRTRLMITPTKKRFDDSGTNNTVSYEANIKSIQKALDEKQDYFQFMIMLTIKSPLLSKMYDMKNKIITEYKKQPMCLTFEQPYKDVEKYFNMYLPFMYIDNGIFNRMNRGCVTETLMSLFPFTRSRTFDETGFPVGINQESKDIVAINNFNRKFFSNANITILGTSGSGKSYFTSMLSSRMLFSGIRTLFICPVKAHELAFHIKSVGGTVIDAIPMSFDTLNLFEIRPEINLEAHEMQESSSVIRGSLLAKKITQIITFTRLCLSTSGEQLTNAERNQLNIAMTNMYLDFGITSDNESIYLNKEKGILKTMPTFTDADNVLRKIPSLNKVVEAYVPFVYGTFKNFNGQTNVSLRNSAIMLNVDEAHIGQEMLPAIMYLSFTVLYDIIKESRIYLDALNIDEVWKCLINDDVGEQIFEAIKVIRGYGGCCITASQDINDLLDNKWGRSIISNSTIKIIKRLEGGYNSECDKTCMALGITDERIKARIPKLTPQEAFIITPQEKILTELKSTELEYVCYATDSEGLKYRDKYMKEHKYALS